MKKFFFLCGLPRAGNTLLSSILNQNKNILVSPNSIIPELFYRVNEIKHLDIYKNFPVEQELQDVLKNILYSYYSSYKQKYIIDRGAWATPYTYPLIKKINKEVKIIFLVRDILEILNSFLNLSNSNENFYLNLKYNYLDKTTLINNKDETICELLMQPEEMIHKQLYSLKYLIDNKHSMLLIEYDDLVSNTKQTLLKIYEYLEIPMFKHNLKKLEEYNISGRQYNDTVLGGPLHKIKKEGIYKNINNRNYLSKKIINKYKDMKFWKCKN